MAVFYYYFRIQLSLHRNLPQKTIAGMGRDSFEIIVKETDEHFPGHTPTGRNCRLHSPQQSKGRTGTGRRRTILVADTIVVLNDHIIGKPVHREDAGMAAGAFRGEAPGDNRCSDSERREMKLFFCWCNGSRIWAYYWTDRILCR